MNRLRVVIEIETYSTTPEEWIGDLVADCLEEDEQLLSITTTASNQ